MLATPTIDKPSSLFNLAHFIFALSVSYIWLGRATMDAVTNSALVVVVASIAAALLALFQPFENLLWLVSGVAVTRVQDERWPRSVSRHRARNIRWLYWSIYLSRERMMFTSGCYFSVSLALFLVINPLQVTCLWKTLGILILGATVTKVLWTLYRAGGPARIAWEVYAMERAVSWAKAGRIPIEWKNENPSLANWELDVVLETVRFLAEAKRMLASGSPKEGETAFRLATGLTPFPRTVWNQPGKLIDPQVFVTHHVRKGEAVR
jgi:hypothetical protein